MGEKEPAETPEMEWLKRRITALDRMDADLQEMRVLAETARDHSLDRRQIQMLNERIEFLRRRVNQLDEQTREVPFSATEPM